MIHRQVTEYLIISAILFENVDDVVNGIGLCLKFNLARIREQKIVFLDPARQSRPLVLCSAEVQAGDRAVHQRGDVRMPATCSRVVSLTACVVWPGPLPFSGGNQKIVADYRQRAIRPETRSSSATWEAFHKLHQARRPSRVATTV